MNSNVDFSKKVRDSIHLLEDMPGIGFLTAATLLAEIGPGETATIPASLLSLNPVNFFSLILIS